MSPVAALDLARTATEFRALYDDFEAYAARAFQISDKHARLVPLRLNAVQREVERRKAAAAAAGRPRRFAVLKHRKPGMSTLEIARNLHDVMGHPFHDAVTLTHEADNTRKLFRAALLMWEKLPPPLQPRRKAANAAELDFPGLHSIYYVGTAGSRAFGRGMTLQRVHGSEVAWWPGSPDEVAQLAAGLTDACRHGTVTFETTAHGVGNYFHELWNANRDGAGAWTTIFVPWYSDPELVAPLPPGGAEAMGLTDEEVDLVRRLGLTPEQVQWRREQQLEMGKLFPQEFPEDDITAFLTSGVHFFDLQRLQALGRTVRPALRVEDNGQLAVWEDPVPGVEYVVGADVAEGKTDGDWSTACVLRRDPGAQVARWRGHCRPEVFAEKAANLALRYHTALLGVERENHGHSTLNTLRHTLHYPRLYEHADYDQVKGHTKVLGWPTTSKTRPIMLNGLNAAVGEGGGMVVNDPAFLAECVTFTDNGNGRYEASTGHHDDLVMGWAIAWQLREKPIIVPRVRILDL